MKHLMYCDEDLYFLSLIVLLPKRSTCCNFDRSWNPPWSSKVFWIARQILLSFCVNLRESAVAGLFDNCPKLRHRSFSVAIFCWTFHLIWYVRYLILDVYLPKNIQPNARPMFFWLLAIKQLSNSATAGMLKLPYACSTWPSFKGRAVLGMLTICFQKSSKSQRPRCRPECTVVVNFNF